jgi:hypothetical protein
LPLAGPLPDHLACEIGVHDSSASSWVAVLASLYL